jgi:serine/threonine-protein kinase
MLSGRLPFEGETPMSVALKQVNSPTPDLRDLNAALPVDLCTVVERMMAKRPDDRDAAPAELARALQRIDASLSESHPLSAASSAAVAEAERGTPSSRTAAADRLATVLRRAEDRKSGNRRWVGVLLCGLLGALLARRAIQVDPLATRDTVVAVPQKDSPRSQYAYASLVNTKEAWEAVLDYFPEDGPAERQRYYALRATTQLARWYLENGDPTNATQMFQQLADLDGTEREFRAIGIAGLALCYEATGDLTQAADLLTDAIPLTDELDDTTKQRLARLERRLADAAKDERDTSLPE